MTLPDNFLIIIYPQQLHIQDKSNLFQFPPYKLSNKEGRDVIRYS